jgi:hypothetical protein
MGKQVSKKKHTTLDCFKTAGAWSVVGSSLLSILGLFGYLLYDVYSYEGAKPILIISGLFATAIALTISLIYLEGK